MSEARSYFDTLEIDGQIIDLSHLQPFEMKIFSEKEGRDLSVRVTFSTHCFSYGYDKNSHPEGWPVIDPSGRKPRTFCPIRYRLSKTLPGLIQGFETTPSKKIFQTRKRRNWCYTMTIEDPSGPYYVFLEISKAANHKGKLQDLDLVVESAYHKDPTRPDPSLLGRMSFNLLCSKTFNREPLATRR